MCGLVIGVPAWAADGVGPDSSSGDAQSAASLPLADLLDFDIPAQPLDRALKRYATLTRRATLFRSELVAGQMSAAVHGRHVPETALRLLLDGTGLQVEKVSTGLSIAFVLKGGGASAAVPRRGLESVSGGADYSALVQARIWDALCADAQTAPGSYRSLLRLQVDAAGAIQRPRLLGSTGDARRDAAMLAVVRRVRLDRPPPPGMPQPVTLLILPREPGDAGAAQHCDSRGEAS